MSPDTVHDRKKKAKDKAKFLQQLINSQDYDQLIELDQRCRVQGIPTDEKHTIQEQMKDIIAGFGFSRVPNSQHHGRSEVDVIFDHLFHICSYGGGGDRYW